MKTDTYRLPMSSPIKGKVVYLLGYAKDGPINLPVPIHSLSEAKHIFREGSLIRAYKEISRFDGITVFLMRISGSYAEKTLLGEVDGNVVPVVHARSYHGGELYSHVHLYIGSVDRDGINKESLIVEIPSEKMSGKAYILEDYETIYDLVSHVNRDTLSRKNVIYLTSEYLQHPPTILSGFNIEITPLVGGEDGIDLSKDELYIALEESYHLLEGEEIDLVCPVDARFDDVHPYHYYGSEDATYGEAVYADTDQYLTLVDTENGDHVVSFHEQLIDFCRQQQQFGVATHGVIGMRNLHYSKEMKRIPYSYIVRLLNQTAFKNRHGLMEFRDGQWYDKGYYITVYAGDVTFDPQSPEKHTSNGAVFYAGILASLGYDQIPTNYPLPNSVELPFEFTSQELRELSFLGVTSARTSVKKGPVISNGVTASLQDSSLHLAVNMRMVQHTLIHVNEVLDDLHGEPFIPVVVQEEIKRRLNITLRELKQNGILLDYHYSLSLDPYHHSVSVHLDLLPKYAIERISVSSNIQFGAKTGGRS